AFLEAIEDLRDGDGFHAVVLDGADHTALSQDVSDDPPSRAALLLHLHVVKSGCVPQRHEIAMKHLLVVPVAFTNDGEGPKCVLGDAAGATKLHGIDDVFATGRGRLRYFRRLHLRLSRALRLCRRSVWCGSLRDSFEGI